MNRAGEAGVAAAWLFLLEELVDGMLLLFKSEFKNVLWKTIVRVRHYTTTL